LMSRSAFAKATADTRLLGALPAEALAKAGGRRSGNRTPPSTVICRSGFIRPSRTPVLTPETFP